MPKRSADLISKKSNSSSLGDPGSKRRHWLITIYDGTLLPKPDAKLYKYFVYQKEKCPSTGRLHWQTFISLKWGRTFGSVCSLFPNQHVDYCDNPEAGAKYCRKLESRVEDPVEFGEFVSQGKRSDIQSFVSGVRAGLSRRDAITEFPSTMARYHRFYETIVSEEKPEQTERMVVLLRGPPGCGKTRWVTKHFPKAYFPPIDDSLWFPGYDVKNPDHDVVCLDDYSGQFKLVNLLRLLHEYPERVPYKGGHIWWNPKLIFITSNFAVEEWYDFTKRAAHLAALQRRITHTFTVVKEGGFIGDEPGDVDVLEKCLTFLRWVRVNTSLVPNPLESLANVAIDPEDDCESVDDESEDDMYEAYVDSDCMDDDSDDDGDTQDACDSDVLDDSN